MFNEISVPIDWKPVSFSPHGEHQCIGARLCKNIRSQLIITRGFPIDACHRNSEQLRGRNSVRLAARNANERADREPRVGERPCRAGDRCLRRIFAIAKTKNQRKRARSCALVDVAKQRVHAPSIFRPAPCSAGENVVLLFLLFLCFPRDGLRNAILLSHILSRFDNWLVYKRHGALYRTSKKVGTKLVLLIIVVLA